MLAACQNKLVRFMRKHLRETGVMPSTAEIQEEFDYRSPATVTSHFEALRKIGVLKPASGKHRGVQFTDAWQPRETRDVPFLGSIPAGYPEDAELQTENSLAFDVEALGLPNATPLFVLEARGDSMVNAGILDGDRVIFEKDAEPRTGEIVAALIDGQTTLKRFLVHQKRAFLRAENPRFKDLIPVRELKIQGVFRGLLRTVRR